MLTAILGFIGNVLQKFIPNFSERRYAEQQERIKREAAFLGKMDNCRNAIQDASGWYQTPASLSKALAVVQSHEHDLLGFLSENGYLLNHPQRQAIDTFLANLKAMVTALEVYVLAPHMTQNERNDRHKRLQEAKDKFQLYPSISHFKYECYERDKIMDPMEQLENADRLGDSEAYRAIALKAGGTPTNDGWYIFRRDP